MSRHIFSHMWQKIADQAVEKKASDIHLGPQSEPPHAFSLYFRMQGLLRFQNSYSHILGGMLIDQLKVQSALDIAERSLPQDGRFSTVGADFRVSTLPCLGGEKAVLRVLRRGDRPQLSSLGLPEKAVEEIRQALATTSGLIVIAGATGSGKTTTIHALLGEIDTQSLNVVTLEDPVEYRAPGLLQVQITKQLSFAVGLRSLLRQDPDVIFVGECRDSETAALALEAAGTGHLVLTTVHTGSVEHIIHRFMELGCPKTSVEQVLRFAAWQQLESSPNGLKLSLQWRSYL